MVAARHNSRALASPAPASAAILLREQSGTPLKELKGVTDLQHLTEPLSIASTPIAHRRSFFCRTSSSTYSVVQDGEERDLQWAQYDNSLYADDGNMDCLESK